MENSQVSCLSSKGSASNAKIGLKDDDDDCIEFEGKIVADRFNNFFCSVRVNLSPNYPSAILIKIDWISFIII